MIPNVNMITSYSDMSNMSYLVYFFFVLERFGNKLLMPILNRKVCVHFLLKKYDLLSVIMCNKNCYKILKSNNLYISKIIASIS